MIDIFSLYEELVGSANAPQSGHIRPNRNFLAWCKSLSMELFGKFYKDFQETQYISDEMYIFLESANVYITATAGQQHDIIKLPDDYKYFASLSYRTYKGVAAANAAKPTLVYDNSQGCYCPGTLPDSVQTVDNDEDLVQLPATKVETFRWSAISARKTNKPSVSNIYFTQYYQGYKILPKGLGIVTLDYFRLPVDPVFNYTVINAGTETEYIQYNPNGSKPLEWSETQRPFFLSRLMQRYGTAIRNPELYQMGQAENRQINADV